LQIDCEICNLESAIPHHYFFLLLDLRLPLDVLLRLELLFFDPLLFRLRLLFVSPASLRCLLTVRAAISFARFVLRPSFFSDSLMCSYCRLRFALFTPRGGISCTSNPKNRAIFVLVLRSVAAAATR
jgi:hypothetical protein